MTLRVPPLIAATLIALATLNAWLIAVLRQEQSPEAEALATKAAWKPKSPSSVAGVPGPKPLTVYGAILAQPLFFKSRQPFVLPPPAPPPAAQPPPAPPPPPADPGLVLGGVIITPDVRRAYVVSKANALGVWASEGETVMGWTVKSIEPGSAQLLQANRTLRLDMYPQGPKH
jgi:hypothetical protein